MDCCVLSLIVRHSRVLVFGARVMAGALHTPRVQGRSGSSMAYRPSRSGRPDGSARNASPWDRSCSERPP